LQLTYVIAPSSLHDFCAFSAFVFWLNFTRESSFSTVPPRPRDIFGSTEFRTLFASPLCPSRLFGGFSRHAAPARRLPKRSFFQLIPLGLSGFPPPVPCRGLAGKFSRPALLIPPCEILIACLASRTLRSFSRPYQSILPSWPVRMDFALRVFCPFSVPLRPL